MTVAPGPVRLPGTYAATGDPVDGNPFPAEDSRHAVWDAATRKAEEEVCRINAEWNPTLQNAPTWLQTLVAARFDVWAKRAVHVVWSDAAVRHYDEWLVSYANACLAGVDEFFDRNPPPVSARAQLIDLCNLLGRQVQHWKGEARRYRADQEAHGAALADAPLRPERTARGSGGPNLAKWLREQMKKRESMTVYRLHVLTDLDPKTIRKMLEGKRVASVRLEKLAQGLEVSLSDVPFD